MSRASLIIPKFEFAEHLDTLISEGETILQNAPTTQNLYNTLGNSAFNEFGYNIYHVEDFDKKYNRWRLLCIEFLESSFDKDQNKYKKEFTHIGSFFPFSSETDLTKLSIDDLTAEINCLKNLKDRLKFIFEKATPTPIPKPKSIQTIEDAKSTGKHVFIVHGHDELMKEKAARTLEQLGLNPIILHEQANGGNTIIEKLEREADKTAFAVVLLTADDFGRAKSETEEKSRARQNVVLELGLFIGKLGRNHVIALIEDGVEIPGDIQGLVYTSIDKGNDWKHELVKELKFAGFNVSSDSIS